MRSLTSTSTAPISPAPNSGTPGVWVSLVWAVLINYGAAQVIWFGLARALPPATSAMSVMAVPLIGTLSAPLIVGEWPRWQDLAAMVCVVVAIGAVLLSRMLIVGVTALCYNRFARRENRITGPMQAVMFWGGLRGALPIALAVSIAPGLVAAEERTLIIQLTLGVILFTILVQGMTMKRVMSRLGLVGGGAAGGEG